MEWSTPDPAGQALAVGLTLAAALLLARRFAATPKAKSLVLLALRAAALAVLLVILLGPVRVSEVRQPARPKGAVFLVDRSRSMALDQPTSRFDVAKGFLREAESRLTPERRAAIARYGFGRDLAAFDRIEDLKPSADESRLRDALERLPARMDGALPEGVYVFSDGRSTEPGETDPVARGFRKLGVPIHVVLLGDTRTVGDLAIQDLVAPREVRPGTRVPIRVVLRGLGLAGKRAEVRVRSLSEPGRKPLAVLPVTLAEGETVADLTIDADQAKGPLVVEVPPFDHEAIQENNLVPFQVAARSPKIRVIYMEGSPGGEEKYVHEALTEDPDIDCLTMILDNQANNVQRLHRVNDVNLGYPTTREELFGYDVVICSDIDRSAFTQAQLDWTVELVGRRGGGFAMVGGITSFGAGRWDQTVWDGLIPIDMSGRPNGGEGTLWANLKTRIPREVEDHPIWRIVDNPAENRRILDAMPPFSGSNLTDRVKPAATVLGLADIAGMPVRGVQMPQTVVLRRPRNAPQMRQAQLMPVFSCQPFGRGRTFSMSTDTTNSWGYEFEHQWGEGDNRYFRKYWRNVVRWLAEHSSNGNRRLQVETDKVFYRPRQPIKISARAFDEHLEPTRRYSLSARLNKPAETARAADRGVVMTLTDDGAYEAELDAPSVDDLSAPPSPTGRKAVLVVSARDAKGFISQSALDVPILDDSPEFRDPRPDHGRLEELARLSGGRVLATPAELADMLAASQEDAGEVLVSRVPVWDHPALWGLLIGLLSIEWVVRRIKGLA